MVNKIILNKMLKLEKKRPNATICWEINIYDNKYLLGQGNIGGELIFPKYLFGAL
jgi:hypothetical protein